MANRSCRRQPSLPATPPPPAAARPTAPEPAMRRWPHPIPAQPASSASDPMLHYIRCTLTYQNEVLGEIKTLLEELLANRDEKGTGR